MDPLPLKDDPLPAWRIVRHEELESTNDAAAREQPWTAVLARRQTRGRGRYRRSWVSDEGGIWLSAVLPTPGPAETWAVLPLAAGWALRQALQGLGVSSLRLRWPNDAMVGKAKLAGILVERFNANSAVVGIGINYDNQPASVQGDLAGMVTRIVDLLQPAPSKDEVVLSVLAHLSLAQKRLAEGGLLEMLPSLNQAWHIKRVKIRLQTPQTEFEGSFLGVDSAGRLLVRTQANEDLQLDPNDVLLLREVFD